MPSRQAVREALEARLSAMRDADDLPEAITYSGNGEPTSHPDFLNIVRDTLALRDKYCPAGQGVSADQRHAPQPRGCL